MPEARQNVLALTNVTVIDTTGSRPSQRATVVIAGDRISEIGEPNKVSLPSGSQTVDGKGKFLLPGLWDMHMHLSLVGDEAIPMLIANGVTGVRDMGGPRSNRPVARSNHERDKTWSADYQGGADG